MIHTKMTYKIGKSESFSIPDQVNPNLKYVFRYLIARFLACSKNGIVFTSQEIDLYAESWNKSCETTGKLFQLVTTMPPHETKKTLSLNEARSCIIAMSKPMAEVAEVIDINLKAINKNKEETKVCDVDIANFHRRLKFKGCDLQRKNLDYPMTVCADEKCKEYVDVGEAGVRNTVYSQICHDHCYLKGIPVQTTNNEQLRDCIAMSGKTCKECGHHYRFHMHITVITTKIEKEYLSLAAQRNIMEKTDLKSQKEALIEELNKEMKELKEEKEVIFKCASFFGVFLKENAMIAYNDSFSEYLDMLIRDEETKDKRIIDRQRIEQLKKEKQEYEERKNVIMKEIASGTKDKCEVIPLEKIFEMRQQLCSLKHNGKRLGKALGIVYLENSLNIFQQ